MRKLAERPLNDDFSGAWCNDSLLTTAMLEAVSFITPVLESFSIKAVADGLPAVAGTALEQECVAFMREESYHSRAHRLLNAKLEAVLGKTPLGFDTLNALMEWTRKRLSVTDRLALAAALEHVTAVTSRSYAAEEAALTFASGYAQELFYKHAQEEIDHRSVVFNLWHAVTPSSRFKRFSTIAVVMLAGGLYLSAAVPWIVYRKSGGRLWRTLSEMTASGFHQLRLVFSLIGDLFSFARGGYHPDHLRDDLSGRAG